MHPAFRALLVSSAALTAAAADFSYYMVSLLYTPNYCTLASAKEARLCGPRVPPFTVAGFWPISDSGRTLENCGAAKPTPADVLKSALDFLPSESFIRQEWSKHGACTGLSAADYFSRMRERAESVTLPELRQSQTSPQMLENDLARLNPGIPRDGFRISCYADGGLREIRVCFDKGFTARACTGAPDCTRTTVTVLPGRR